MWFDLGAIVLALKKKTTTKLHYHPGRVALIIEYNALQPSGEEGGRKGLLKGSLRDGGKFGSKLNGIKLMKMKQTPDCVDNFHGQQ